MDVGNRLKRFLRSEEDTQRRQSAATKAQHAQLGMGPLEGDSEMDDSDGNIDEVKDHTDPPPPRMAGTPAPQARKAPEEPARLPGHVAPAPRSRARQPSPDNVRDHELMRGDTDKEPRERAVMHPVGHSPPVDKPKGPPKEDAPAVPPQGYPMPSYPYVMPPMYPAYPPYGGPYYPPWAPMGDHPGSAQGGPTKGPSPALPKLSEARRMSRDGNRRPGLYAALSTSREETEALARGRRHLNYDEDKLADTSFDGGRARPSGLGLRRRRHLGRHREGAMDADAASTAASIAEIVAEEDAKDRVEDTDEATNSLRIILEPSTQSEVVSIVEMGSIACLSGRLPGVSISYALVLFLVVAIASAVLMSAAQSSYEGVPCEQQSDCFEGSFCTEDDVLGVCRSCLVREFRTDWNFPALVLDLLNADRLESLTFENNEVQEERFDYLCPQLISDLGVCEERCETPRCIESQYLAFFSLDEPATIIVAVFTIIFFALLSREQQQQTLSAFFYMRHEVKYNPLKELSKRLKSAKKHSKRYRAYATPTPKAAEVETKAAWDSDEDDAAQEAADLDDILDPLEDDFSSVDSEGTIEAKLNNFRFICSIYSGAAVQVVLQVVALPLMRIALFIELISLRTAVLVSTVTIMFSNATILDFLVNSLAVLFVLELDEAIFNTINQSVPSIANNYIIVHQRAELTEHRREVLHKRRKAARQAGIPVEAVNTVGMDEGFSATMPQILLTAFETNLLRAACVLHAITIFVYSIIMLQSPMDKCYTSGEDYLRFVWTTAIILLYGEVFFFTAIHFVYNYFISGNNLALLPMHFVLFTIFNLLQFIAVFIFQHEVFQLLQKGA